MRSFRRRRADTLRNTSLLEITNYSRALSAADLLWIVYYTKNLNLQQSQQKVKSNQVAIDSWTSGSDVEITREVIQNRKY